MLQKCGRKIVQRKRLAETEPHITAKTTADYTQTSLREARRGGPHITAKTTADYTVSRISHPPAAFGPHITAKTTADYTPYPIRFSHENEPHITAKTTADYTPYCVPSEQFQCLTSPPKRRRTTPRVVTHTGRQLVPHITAKTTADYTTSCYSLHSNSAPHITAKTTADYTLCSKRSRQKE